MDALGNVAVKLIGSQYHRFTYAPTGEELEWDPNFSKPTIVPIAAPLFQRSGQILGRGRVSIGYTAVTDGRAIYSRFSGAPLVSASEALVLPVSSADYPSWLAWTHRGLDIVGFVPIIGDIVDIIHAGAYGVEAIVWGAMGESGFRDTALIDMGLTAASALPIIGDIGGKGVKWGRDVVKVARATGPGTMLIKGATAR